MEHTSDVRVSAMLLLKNYRELEVYCDSMVSENRLTATRDENGKLHTVQHAHTHTHTHIHTHTPHTYTHIHTQTHTPHTHTHTQTHTNTNKTHTHTHTNARTQHRNFINLFFFSKNVKQIRTFLDAHRVKKLIRYLVGKY